MRSLLFTIPWTWYFTTSLCYYIGGSSIGFRDPGFPLFEARDSGFKSKIGTRFGIESVFGRGMPKITLGFTGLHEILGWDYWIEEPHWGPSCRHSICLRRYGVLKKHVVLRLIWAHSTTVVTLRGSRLYEGNLSRVEESLPYPIHSGRVSYNSSQNLASRLHEKQKVGSARRLTRLARPTFFHANSLARPAGSSWKETIRACTAPFVVSVGVGQRGQLFFVIVSTHLSRDNYSRLPITRTF